MQHSHYLQVLLQPGDYYKPFGIRKITCLFEQAGGAPAINLQGEDGNTHTEKTP